MWERLQRLHNVDASTLPSLQEVAILSQCHVINVQWGISLLLCERLIPQYQNKTFTCFKKKVKNSLLERF